MRVTPMVSIRRADRCLVEDMIDLRARNRSMFQSAVRIAVWLKMDAIKALRDVYGFQSAVRIAVWLKNMPTLPCATL